MAVEYKIRPVKRFVVTRYEGDATSAGSTVQGEFDNFDTAYVVGNALARAEQERLGLPPGDIGVIFPDSTEPKAA